MAANSGVAISGVSLHAQVVCGFEHQPAGRFGRADP